MAETVRGPDGLSDPERYSMAALFAAGASVTALSAEFCIAERTVYRWLRDPEVQRLINEIRSATVSSVSGKLTHRLQRYMDRLDALTESQDERVALQACRIGAEMVLKLRSFEEFDARLKALEDRQAGKAVLA